MIIVKKMIANIGDDQKIIYYLKPSASEKEIKMEYFKLAKKYHPDLNPDESARCKFENVQKAYEILSD